MKHFVIPFAGLKAGTYDFAFEIDDEFFAHFERSEISKGKVHVDCVMDRQQRMLTLNFDITGTVTLPCDRCADDYEQAVVGHQRLIVKFGTVEEEESEEIQVIPEKEHELDVSQYLYEYIHLLLPMRRVHGTDATGKSLCNPEVADYIADIAEPPADPRWDTLKKLKDNIDENDN